VLDKKTPSRDGADYESARSRTSIRSNLVQQQTSIFSSCSVNKGSALYSVDPAEKIAQYIKRCMTPSHIKAAQGNHAIRRVFAYTPNDSLHFLHKSRSERETINNK